MRSRPIYISLIIAVAIILNSCGLFSSLAATPTGTPTPNAFLTSVAITATAVALASPTIEATTTPTATITPTITETETPVPTDTPTNIPTSTFIPFTPAPTFTPTSVFAVTHIDMDVNDSNVTVACGPGFTFEFTAEITTNAAGTVTYYWERSDGAKSSQKSLDFDEARSHSVTFNWTLGNSGVVSPNPFKGWVRVYVNKPNQQFFSKANFTLKCS